MQSTHPAIVSSMIINENIFFPRESLITSLAVWQYEGYNLHEELLREGFGWDAIKELGSWAVNAAAEYGLGALTLPAAGAGVAVGPAVDTFLDGLGIMDSIRGAIDTIQGFASQAGQFKELLQQCMEAKKLLTGGLGPFYDKVLKIVKTGLKLLGKKAGEKVDAIANKLSESIAKLVDKISEAIGKCVKFVIPDATLGSTISLGVKTTLKQLSKTPYDMLKSVVGKLGKLANFLFNAERTESFIMGMGEKLTDLIGKIKEKVIEKKSKGQSALKKFILAASPAAAIVDKLVSNTAIYDKGIDLIKKYTPQMASIAKTIISVVVPALTALLAVYQIIVNKEYKKSNTDKEGTTSTKGKEKVTTKEKTITSPEKSKSIEKSEKFKEEKMIRLYVQQMLVS